MQTNTTDATADGDEVYAEGTPLTQLLGDGPKVRILAALLGDPDFDHSITEIADLAGVSRNTVYRHLDDLRDLGVVVKTRETGGSKRYQIDKDDPVARKLADLEWELIDVVFEE